MKDININFPIGIGIVGTTITEKKKNGDETEIKITRTGTSNYHIIPPLIVFCEDELAKEVISITIQKYNLNLGSYNIITCGSWINIITSLFGCILYSQQLKETGNNKVLEVIGIIDGDITSDAISKIIKKTYCGNFVPDRLQKLTNIVSNHVTSFNLNISKDSMPKNTTGTPEFNIKTWFEEIDQESILKKHNQKIEELEDWIEKSNAESKDLIRFELDDIHQKIQETLKLIDISKNIDGVKELRSRRKRRKGEELIDYHQYFTIMKKKTANIYYSSYQMTHYPINLIFNIICEYNNDRWIEYSKSVYELLKSSHERQVENFNFDTFNNDRI